MKKSQTNPVLAFLCLCWLYLFSTGVFSAEKVLDVSMAIEADNLQSTGLSLTEYFAVLEDSSLKLTLADIQSPDIAKRFSAISGPASDLHYGYSGSAYWLRLRLKNPGEHRLTRMLEIQYPSLSFVQLHQPALEGQKGAQNGYYSVYTGLATPFSTRPYRNRQFVFPLTLPAHSEQIVYLRIQSDTSVIIPAKLWTPQAFHEYERNDYLVQALYFGIAIALFLFNLLLFFALRDIIYLLYIAFISSSTMVIATHTGLAHEFLWPKAAAWANSSTFVAYSLAIATFSFFLRIMLNTVKNVPKLDKVVIFIGIAYLTSPILFIVSVGTFSQLAAIMNFISLLSVLGIGLFLSFKGQKNAFVFVAVFSFLLIGGAMTCLRTLGLLATNIYTINALHFGMAAEMVLLAFAVADRFNRILREKREAEIQTLAAQSHLAQAEKMASLGQLIASVGHEINTPIGAVKSSGNTISSALNQALLNMPKLFQTLDNNSVALFLTLIKTAQAPHSFTSSREERAITRQITVQLDAAGIANPRHKAGILAQLNTGTDMDPYLPLLQHPESELILDTANNMATIINSANNINIAIDSVAKIILALKSFSRVDQTATKIEAHLRDGLETVLTIYQGKLKQGTELVREYENIPAISCLPDELNQVWTNLIHNALQAMNYQGTLTIGIRQIGNEAVVSVGDTGSGIPEGIREKIFDVFFTTKPAGEGSGLGLDIVKKIIAKHHGRIDFQTAIGVGSTFFVYLPYAEKQA